MSRLGVCSVQLYVLVGCKNSVGVCDCMEQEIASLASACDVTEARIAPPDDPAEGKVDRKSDQAEISCLCWALLPSIC